MSNSVEIYIASFRDTAKRRKNTTSSEKVHKFYGDKKILASTTNCSIYQNDVLTNNIKSTYSQYADKFNSMSSDYNRELYMLGIALELIKGGDIHIVYSERYIGKFLTSVDNIIKWMQTEEGRLIYRTYDKDKFVENILGYELSFFQANPVLNPSAKQHIELLNIFIKILAHVDINLTFENYKSAPKIHRGCEDKILRRSFDNFYSNIAPTITRGDNILLEANPDKQDAVLKLIKKEKSARKAARVKLAIDIQEKKRRVNETCNE